MANVTIKKELQLDLTVEQLEGIEADIEAIVKNRGYSQDDIVDYRTTTICTVTIIVKKGNKS